MQYNVGGGKLVIALGGTTAGVGGGLLPVTGPEALIQVALLALAGLMAWTIGYMVYRNARA